MGVKAWWQSKSMWAAIVTAGVGIYNAGVIPAVQASFGVILPPIPAWILGIAGAVGIYGRATATTKIG